MKDSTAYGLPNSETDATFLSFNVPRNTLLAKLDSRQMTEFLRFTCSSCGRRLKCLPKSVGKVVRCPHCMAPTTAQPPPPSYDSIERRVTVDGWVGNDDFWRGLPINFPLCGYLVSMARYSEFCVSFNVPEKPTENRMSSDGLDYFVDATAREVADFLTYYLSTPGGRALLSSTFALSGC